MSELQSVCCEDDLVEVNDCRLAVRRVILDAGDLRPEPIVLLHEGLGCIELWRSFPQRLALRTGREVLVFDRLGHGRSDRLREKRSVNYLSRCASQELAPLLEKLEIENPVLVGHSDGGTIALLHAARNQCSAAVAVAAHAAVEEEALSGIRNTVRRWSTTRLRQSMERFHGDKAEELFLAWSETWLADWFRDWSIFGELAALTCPTMVLQGAEDEYASVQHPYEIASAVGENAEVHILPDCGHSPHLQQPDLLLERIVTWLELKLR